MNTSPKTTANSTTRPAQSRLQTGKTDVDSTQQCINALRFLSVDMVQKADSGHPGLPLDAAPMACVLWTEFLRHNPQNPTWFNRDRFVLSAGHGSALLYSLLDMTGYDVSLEDIKHFRQWGSKTPGHPERDHTPGVETTTGPLGQGFANGVGMAMTEAHLAARFNHPGHAIIHHYTYGLVSDGDLMEGVSAESASLAGHLKLGRLIYLYDSNHISLSASTDLTFAENCAERFNAYGWHTLHVEDGNDVAALRHAIKAAQEETERPSLIIVRTHIGYGSPHKQDSYEAHGSQLGEDEVALTKENLGWPVTPDFYVPEEALAHFRKAVEHGKKLEQQWQEAFSAYQKEAPALANELQHAIRGDLLSGWDTHLPTFEADSKGVATRVASGKIMNAIAPYVSALIGGSADLNPSTYTALENLGNFESPLLNADANTSKRQGAVSGCWGYDGRNMAFGVREHAMGSILNGMAAHGGVIPFGATFLIFSDYMRPPMRLAALMGLKIIYVFTHDSIGLGEDGPTHQPIEQLAGLRAIPRLVVIRPADANETVAAWRITMQMKDRPVALILSRQKLPTLNRIDSPEKAGQSQNSKPPEKPPANNAPTEKITPGKTIASTSFVAASAEGMRQGAYILADAPNQKPDLILIATGSEVHLIVEAAEKLQQQGIQTRLVSMPSWELFEEQDNAYKKRIFPPDIKTRLAVEAGSPQGWERYVGDQGEIIGIDHFGASAPGEVLMREFGFTAEHVYERASALLQRNQER
jgi:transketolase